MGRKRHNQRFWPMLLLLAGVGSGLSGCIKNDIPFETVPGNITAMEIRGAEELTLDNTTRTIELTLADTVDLRRVYLRDFRITPDARMVDNVTGQEMDTLDSYYLDLTQGGAKYEIPADKTYGFTVITYQDYVWTLQARQNIARSFVLDDGLQIGEAKFSAVDYSVTAYVPENVSLNDVEVKELRLGPSNSTMAWLAPDGTEVENVDVRTIRDWNLPQRFIVRFFDIEQTWTVTIEQSMQYVTEMTVNPWAKFAYFSAQGLTSAGECGFQVRPAGAGDDAWSAVSGVEVDGTSFSGKATGLQPATNYEVRGVIGDNYGDPVAFTTEAAVEVPNLNFNTWTQKGKSWFPNADAANSYWATGNDGVVIYASPNSVPVEGAGNAVEGRAARLETLGGVPLVQIAAGNLFTGNYTTNLGNPASSAVMGRPYTGRPTRMTGWYKYTPKVVTVGGNKYSQKEHPDAVGSMDYCTIYIRLEDWGGATERPANPKVIAYAGLEDNTVVEDYKQFDLTLEYYDRETRPTHIVIVASSSRYGDDFCGGPGSVLYVDQFALSFDEVD
ncbi:PCMD domain-containing protein [uncultured Rikenella sp.]|uniref:PCMD domain-containing protein n=2 Tax=uncultured Rikenella sp. TaxID=368003 RepID=UPI002630B2AE|nr:PCMD domain-containing protein [uncultured Rikenella sp.]